MNYSRESLSSPLCPSPVVERSLNLRLRSAQAIKYLKWGCLHSVILVLLILDLSQTCGVFKKSLWYMIEYAIAIFIFMCAVACLGKYMWFLCSSGYNFGTEQQRTLLYNGNDNSFKTISLHQKKRRSYEPDTDVEDDLPIVNWHSSFEESRWGSQSMRRSPSPMRSSQQQQNTNTSFNNTNNSLNISNISNESAYKSPYEDMNRDDVRKTPAFMRWGERDRSRVEANDSQYPHSNGSVNSFWNYCNNAAYMLRNTIYHLAPAPPISAENTQSSIEDFGLAQYKDSNSEVIKCISTDRLSQYLANLRYWISTTILQRLAKEINHVDDLFRQRGFSDMKIGSVGLERLRQMAENQQFLHTCAPMLPMLLPFLDTFSNQEYLVQRIKELAQGSCIAAYRWNSGNAHNGQEWGEHLPTDAAILFHLFCVYLDSQLMPLPQGDGRPFYSRYVLTRDEKRLTKDIVNAVHNKAHCAILCTGNYLNPKFNFISEKELHNCAYDRNNLFYVIIQFLIYMRTQQDSALEGVNLGKCGINIMCVIED
ncbi:transmembrane protein 209 [Scaptodrosophila lebanonensis]|uniref:Transmembrane protein 209 n=1 Tax=Drosophila lebanonensis TaxID=7225 RepID=A0A6J2UA74_DROLE|nr:transmembrane protein 209 [Scaptodrosophila lebanonensis]